MVNLDYSLAGVVTGFVVGLTGVGGGALMTPLLLLVFGVSPATAVATDLWFAAITKSVGAVLHHRSGAVDWQVAKRMWWGSLPVSLGTVVLVARGSSVERSAGLGTAIGGVVLLTAVGLLAAPRLLAGARARRIADPVRFKAAQPALTVVAGALLGVCVALTSVGAGALGSVALVFIYPLRMTPHRLVATDVVHAIPLAVVAGSGYLVAGLVDGAMLVSMLIGSVPAVVVGTVLAHRLRGRALQVALAVVLAGVAAKLLV